MQTVREAGRPYDDAVWSAETVVHGLELPDETADPTQPYVIDRRAFTEEATVLDRPRAAPARSVRRQAQELGGHIARSWAEQPFAWVLVVLMMALGLRGVCLRVIAEPTPIGVHVVAP